MILRWIHTAWKFLMTTLVTLLVVGLSASLLLFGLLQLPGSKQWTADRIEQQFNRTYQGTLTIGELDGLLPFRIQLHEFRLYDGDDREAAVLSAERLHLDVRLWSLLQRTVSFQFLELDRPTLHLEAADEQHYTIQRALNRRIPSSSPDDIRTDSGLELMAPSIRVNEGTLTGELPADSSPVLADLIPISSIDASIYLELSDSERFLDIGYITGETRDPRIGSFFLSGQLFSDHEFLELNGFQFRSTAGQLAFTAEATPVDLFAPELEEQLRNAEFRFDLSESLIHGETLQSYLPDWPFEESPLNLELHAEGSLETLWLDRLIGTVGESSILFTGEFHDIDTPEFSWQITLDNLLPHPGELNQLLRNDPYREQRVEFLTESRFHGRLSGGLDYLEGSLDLGTGFGSLHLAGYLAMDEHLRYRATGNIDSLDVTPLFPEHLQYSFLDGDITFEGEGRTLDELAGSLTARLNNSQINRVAFSGGELEADWRDGRLEHRTRITTESSSLITEGTLQRDDELWSMSLDGETRNINLLSLYPGLAVPLQSLSMEYRTRFEWQELNDLSGQVSFQVDEAVVDSVNLPPHQFYVDLDRPVSQEGGRQLRLTSTFLDAELEGDIDPNNLTRLYHHWKDYFEERYEQEIAFRDQNPDQQSGRQEPPAPDPAALSLQLELKDLSLLRHYSDLIPDLESNSSSSFNLTADREQLLLTGSFQDREIRYESFSADRLQGDVTASFRHGVSLRDYTALDLQLRGENYSWNDLSFNEGHFNSSMRNDTVMVQHSSRGGREGLSMDLTALSRFHPDRIESELRRFMFGTDSFSWSTEGTPRFIYRDDGGVQVDELVLVSGEERVELDGIYSNDPNESVNYRINSLQLDRISDLIGGRVRFGGILHADFQSRTLTTIPLIEGELEVERGTLDNRLIGDVSLSSRYESSRDRFDTEITVHTDPNSYPRYYERNDNIGQDLRLQGFFTVPDFQQPEEEFFYFDADLREIDTWIATVIVPSIIEESEGRTTGWGYISGSLTDINFRANFDIEEVTVVPAFLNTRYTTSGRLVFDRHEGLHFDDISIRDPQGGTGLLYGSVDLDDFSDTNYMDLTLDMQNLHFMNNPYNPDVPFHASTRGTGQARITGSNFSPYLRTTQPIAINRGSRVTVPLLDETELQQGHSFIQFVDTFDLNLLRQRREEQQENGEAPPSPDQLTFTERFRLDLQFSAENPVNFHLVFDPVTNEALNANGTGQLRLTLEDQNFNLFGRMNISGGNYHFVAGDIISRRFMLSEGGSIIWEGDPANARLNVEATYRARPDLTSLLTTTTPGRMEGAQRVPIDLVLNIGGTLSALENDFFFRVPSNIEGTLDPTMITQINALNRNEEEKVIQATSLLLSGNFIPLASASTEGGTGSAFREALTGGAVVNPLITGQVINPLLSDQINSLLRSDMTLDIDFNLTPYNQVDLGVALRLYDDRLILRRDGQITGPYSDIGDLGATYRINQIFAVTAFHRQDPTLANSSSTEPRQVQEMNGVGLEAQFQFNTWQEIRQRIADTFNRIFGHGSRDPEDEEELSATGEIRQQIYSFD